MSDSTTLLHLAGRLDVEATEVRERAARLVALTHRVRWQSRAADVFRLRGDHCLRGLERTAGELERAAEALRRHARMVAHIEQVAATIEHAGEAVARGVAQVGRHLTGWL